MSQIKLLHSGGNGVILSAPDSNPASDRTLKLPGDANSTVDTLNRAGNILQVLQTVKTDTTSINSTSMTAISGMSVNITPSSTSSKILVIADLKIGENGTATQLRLVRGSTAIYTGANAGANFNDISWSGYGGSDTGQGYYGTQPVTLTFLDSPNTTSQITYAVHWCRQNNAVAYLNKTGNDGGVYSTRLASSILVQEVAA